MTKTLCGFLMLIASSAAAAVVTGSATEVAPDIVHPNGNIYDQVLMTGAEATVRADPGQITRVSFIDLNFDIVQVEFSGAGSLTVSLAAATGPAPAVKYNQPGVSYMKGHATVTIFGCDASTNLTVFSVGTATAQNQSIFRSGVMYDGIADLQRITVVSDPANPNGSVMGSIRAGNAQFWGASGPVGIAAASVHVQNVVVIGDLWATDTATPILIFGTASRFGTLTVAGGDLSQPNGKAINANGSYMFGVESVEGRTSHNIVLPRQALRAQLDLGGGVVETLPPYGPFGPF